MAVYTAARRRRPALHCVPAANPPGLAVCGALTFRFVHDEAAFWTGLRPLCRACQGVLAHRTILAERAKAEAERRAADPQLSLDFEMSGARPAAPAAERRGAVPPRRSCAGRSNT